MLGSGFPGPKFSPVTVIVIPPFVGPDFGVIDRIIGAIKGQYCIFFLL